MRYIFSILFLFVSLIVSGTNYYVATAGSDASGTPTNPLTPWKTIDKVNTVWLAGTFNAGDSILFNRGNTFYGKIRASEGGSSGNPIVIGAYGTGADPIITGFVAIDSWTDYGAGTIYYKVIDTYGTELNMLTIDGAQYHMGIFPDLPTKYYIEKRLDNVNDQWIYDSDLPSTPVWTYGTLVAIQNTGICSQSEITNHRNDTIWFNDDPSWSSYGEMNLNWRFFIQDNYETLTTFGEWFHDGDTLFMYFGAEAPGDYTVEIAVQDTLFYGTSTAVDYIHITNLHFKGANSWAIHSRYGDYWEIKDCKIELAGEEGINLIYADYCLVDGCTISKCNDAGVYASRGSDYLTVKNNTIRDIGLFYGAGSSSHGLGVSCIPGGGTAPTGTLVEYNVMRNMGRRGTWIDGLRDTIRYNYIDSVGVRYKDAAGIYTGTSNDTLYAIYSNIITNIFGSPDMSSATSVYGGADGIAIDFGTRGVNIYENVIAYGWQSAIAQNCSNHLTIQNNICFDHPYGYKLEEAQFVSGDPLSINNDMTVTGNIVVNPTNQLLYRARYTVTPFTSWGTLDSNYFLYDATDLTNVNRFISGTNSYMSLEQWKLLYGWEEHSDAIVFENMNYVKLYYNPTDADSTVTLDYTYMRDVSNNKYITSFVLSSFTGKVLYLDEEPYVPPVTGTGFSKTTDGKYFLKSTDGTQFMKIE